MAKDDKNTAGIPGYEASLEDAARYDIQPHLINMLLTEPFFAELMRGVTKVREESMPTAGVSVKDGELYLYYGPRFMAALNPKEHFGVLKHEAYHLIFNHCTSRRLTPHSVANFAGDLAINSIIPEDEMPKVGLRPGRALDLSRVKDPTQLAKWQKVSDKIVSFPQSESMEWYFARLMEDPEVQDTIVGPEGEAGLGIGEMDSHEGWGDMTDEERAVAEARVKQALGNAVRKSDRTGQWGSVSAEMRETLRKLVEDSVDWRKLLRNFVGTSQRLNKASTLRRINRKYPYIHPGVTRSHTATVAVFVDMSGSVGDEDLERIYGVLGGLAKQVTFKFYPFDYTVDEKNAFEWKKGQKKPPVRYRAGGTSFKAVNEFVKKHRNEFDGVIICTDGEAEDPGPSPLRRAWVLVPNTKLLFPTPRGDIVIAMDKEKKKAQAA
jgi:predicted metal-dependent peptidase